MTEEKARNLDPGTEIIVPDGIIPESSPPSPAVYDQPPIPQVYDRPPAPTPSSNESTDSVVVGEGSTIIDALKKAGVEDPMLILDEVFKANNNMTEEKARNLDPGTEIIVPDGIIPDNTSDETPALLIESDQLPASAELNSNGGVGTEEYGPQAPKLVYNQPPAPVETTNSPEIVAAQSIEDVLIEMRPGYENETADIGKLVEFLTNTLEHPEIDPSNGITEENVHLLFKLPKPQAGFDYIVNPATCSKEAITSATMLAFIIVTQDYAQWLTQNDSDFSHLNGIWKLVIADLNSGVHKTHQNGRAADLQSIFNNFTDFANPDGPLFMTGKDGFNSSFNEKVIPFMQQIKLSGEQVAEHVVVTSRELERSITGANERGDFVAHDDKGWHSGHLHAFIRQMFEVPGFFSQSLPLSCDDPLTGGPVEFDNAPVNTTPETTIENPIPSESEQETNTDVESIESLISDGARNYEVVDPITAYVTSKNSTNNGGDLSFDEAYGPTIKASDVYVFLRLEGASHEEAVILTAIASRETGLRPGSVGDVEHETNGQITASYGLFQIMALGGDFRDSSENLNPRLAARNALMLMRQSGLDPWETFMPDEFTVNKLADAIDLSHRRKPLNEERAEDIAENVLNQVEAVREQVDNLLGA
jgi:hypothetical protein